MYQHYSYNYFFVLNIFKYLHLSEDLLLWDRCDIVQAQKRGKESEYFTVRLWASPLKLTHAHWSVTWRSIYKVEQLGFFVRHSLSERLGKQIASISKSDSYLDR